eukprot:5431973-Pleurochrysis_carterae.AAC.4
MVQGRRTCLQLQWWHGRCSGEASVDTWDAMRRVGQRSVCRPHLRGGGRHIPRTFRRDDDPVHLRIRCWGALVT